MSYQMKHSLEILLNVKLWLVAIILQATPVLNHFLNKYIFSDMDFLVWLLIVMALDLITGVTKAWKRREDITSKGLRDTISKCIQYGSFLIITHVLTHFSISGAEVNSKYEWFDKLAYQFILLIEIKSVYENIVAINPALDVIKEVVGRLSKLLSKDESKKDS